MSELLDAVQVGANLVNQRYDRSIRMQQLRAQQAQQQMMERHYAAQAQVLVQHAQLYKAQQQEIEDKRMLGLAARDIYNKAIESGASPKDALQESIMPLALVDPSLADDIARAQAIMEQSPEQVNLLKERATTEQSRQQKYNAEAGQVGQPTPKTPEDLELIKQRTETQKALADKYKADADARKAGSPTAMTVTEKDYRSYADAVKTGDPVKAQVFGKKLGIMGLSEEDSRLHAAILTSLQGTGKDAEKKMREVTEEFKKRASGSVPSFKKGQRVKQGGVVYEFDGNQMVPVQ